MNRDNIESSAVAVLMGHLSKCPILSNDIKGKDTILSWDGQIFVYNNENHSKDNLKGRIPLQLKGHLVDSVEINEHKERVSIADLKNYRQDGGILYFVVLIDKNNLSKSKTFYKSLLPFDLDGLLLNKSQSVAVSLDVFPIDDTGLIQNICLNFLLNKEKQYSLKNINIDNKEELVDKNTKFSIPIVASQENFRKTLFSLDFYEYITKAFPGGSVDIVRQRIKVQALQQKIKQKIYLDNICYFKEYQNKACDNGDTIIVLASCLEIKLAPNSTSCSVIYTPKGSLDDNINALDFLIKLHKGNELVVGKTKVALTNKEVPVDFPNWLAYYNKIKKVLAFFKVKTPLHVETLTHKCRENTNVFCSYIENTATPIKLSGVKQDVGLMITSIGNINILLMHMPAKEHDYNLFNFFEHNFPGNFYYRPHESDESFPGSRFLRLSRGDYEKANNIDYAFVIKDLFSYEYTPYYSDLVNNTMLDIISAYDKTKDESLYKLAKQINKYLLKKEPKKFPFILNEYQINKRKRKLNKKETANLKNMLKEVGDDSDKALLSVGINILLGEREAAESRLSNLDADIQNNFKTYPIWNLLYPLPSQN